MLHTHTTSHALDRQARPAEARKTHAMMRTQSSSISTPRLPVLCAEDACAMITCLHLPWHLVGSHMAHMHWRTQASCKNFNGQVKNSVVMPCSQTKQHYDVCKMQDISECLNEQ